MKRSTTLHLSTSPTSFGTSRIGTTRIPRCRDIRDRCTRFGIGLIVFSDPANVDSFTVKVDAQRHQPAGDAVDEFIESRMPAEQRKIVLEWIGELR